MKAKITTNTQDMISKIYTIKFTFPLKVKKGTARKFRGCLSKLFPELKNVTDEEIDEMVKR